MHGFQEPGRIFCGEKNDTEHEELKKSEKVES
jgi:hypothetical protein